MVYALTLSYVGTAYHGWQRQPNASTIQEVVEAALADLLAAPVSLVAAGRTDAGVHARGQVAHLQPGREFPLSGLVHGTNHRLPPDIRVLAAERMQPGFHARKCAEAKEYRYRLSLAPVVPPLDAPFCWGVPGTLDRRRLDAGAARLVGRHDFTAFALAGGSHEDPRRRLFAAGWRREGDQLVFRVVGEGFLRGMVRALVGTLVEIGRGRRAVEDLDRLLSGAPRGAAGPTAPARGLVLQEVRYALRWRVLSGSGGAPPEEPLAGS